MALRNRALPEPNNLPREPLRRVRTLPAWGPSLGLDERGVDGGTDGVVWQMVNQQGQRRLPWEDRFNVPTVDELRLPLPNGLGALFEEARRDLITICDQRVESMVWHGPCWRWTLEYRVPAAPQPIAVLIPNPDDLQLAAPMRDDFVRSIWNRRMRRSTRDGLELAAAPYDNEWCVWSLASQSILEEVIDVVRRKIEFSRSN